MFWEKLRRWMYGRYGADSLSFTLLIIGILLMTVSRVFGFWPGIVLAWAVYGYALFRILSRNVTARQKELYTFRRLLAPFQKWFRIVRTAFRERKTYKYFRCPSCRQVLRAPRGRGKILVTCQRCHKEFKQKT